MSTLSRHSERRLAITAGVMLGLVLLAHAMLETARDALFLASLPASQLPFVYVGVAIAAGVTMRLLDALKRSSREVPAAPALVFAALGTLIMWGWLRFFGSSGLYALYIWTGTAITVVLVRLWLEISAVFNVAQARRLYPSIRTGSVVGAIAGSGIASLFSHFTDRPAELLPLAALVLLASLIPAHRLAQSQKKTDDEPDEEERESFLRDLGVLRAPYARRLLGLLLLSTVTLTLGDYIFKATLAEAVPADSLGSIFGVIYFVTNLLGLGCQLWLVKVVVDRVGPIGAIAALPIAVVIGGAGIVGLAGITGALAYKGLEGPLRHTVDRTAVEMLFVPLTDRARERVKRIADTAVKRGGQALGSLLILGALALDLPSYTLGGSLIGLSALWAVSALALRGPYLSMFHRSIRFGQGAHSLPPLGLDSLEQVMRRLDSTDDSEVLAALGVLAEERRLGMVPTLLLYHPTEAVVVRAAELLADDGREELVGVANRLIDRSTPAVHAALLVAQARIAAPPTARLERLAESPCDATSTVARVLLVHHHGTPGERTVPEFVSGLLEEGSEVARRSFAVAVGRFPHPLLDPVLTTLATDSATSVRRAALEAISTRRERRFLPALVEALADPRSSKLAREAIRALPPAAALGLLDALVDPSTPLAARWELPRLMVQLNPETSVEWLVRALPATRNTTLHLPVLRALAIASSQAATEKVPTEAVREAEEQAADSCRKRMDAERLGDALELPAFSQMTTLLRELLRGRREQATEELLLAMALRYPGVDYTRLWTGLHASDASTHDASLELLRSMAAGPHRELLLGLLDDDHPDPPAQGEEAGLDLDAILERLVWTDDRAIRAVATTLRDALGSERAARGA